MKTRTSRFRTARASRASSGAIFALAMLSAWNAGATFDSAMQAIVDGASPAVDAAPVATLPPEVAAAEAFPAFHALPVVLPEPSGIDSFTPDMSANRAPFGIDLPFALDPAVTRRLTLDRMDEAYRSLMQREALKAMPYATPTAATVFTPAQIRAAYNLPALPAAGATLSAAQISQLGGGQTVYVVGAYHDPNAAAALAAFNAKFGLPTCTTKSVTALPLPAVNPSACEFYQVVGSGGSISTAVPGYNSGWATELALDVQWVHATAPLARIVLIEGTDPSNGALVGAVQLADNMGPGIVSMSWGANEGSWVTAAEPYFGGAGMTYLAATGDNGAGVSWPAVSTKVVGVGGTSLTWSGSGSRSERTWSGSGGGTSLYVAQPGYQTTAVPGIAATPTKRMVADVAFNGDPATGQYVAFIPQSGGAAQWLSVGGTSLSTPQWAGLLAVANSMRAANSMARLGQPHATLYGTFANAGNYATAFLDITTGTDGTCGTCTAKTGYDTPTGLGTPNAWQFLNLASSAALPPTAPVVKGDVISGVAATALKFTATVTATNAVTFSLTGAPSGMTVSTAGVVSWPSPVVGRYSVSVNARDTKTNLVGSGTFVVTIVNPPAPVVAPVTTSSLPAKAFSYKMSFTSSNPVTWTLTGAPSGVTINADGLVSWAAPVLGTYSFTVTARDTKVGLTGTAAFKLTVANATGLAIATTPAAGVAARRLTMSIVVTDTDSTVTSISVAGSPSGLTWAMSGLTLVGTWASPVTGTYSVAVTATDAKGATAKATQVISIAAR